MLDSTTEFLKQSGSGAENSVELLIKPVKALIH